MGRAWLRLLLSRAVKLWFWSTISTALADFWHQHYNLRQNFKNIRQINLIYHHFDVHTNQETFLSSFLLLCFKNSAN